MRNKISKGEKAVKCREEKEVLCYMFDERNRDREHAHAIVICVKAIE